MRYTFEHCIMICTCHYSIMKSSFKSLKILFALPIHPISLQRTPDNQWHCAITIAFPFPECHTIWLIQCRILKYAFKVPHVLSWLDSSFLCSTEKYSIVWMYQFTIHYPLKNSSRDGNTRPSGLPLEKFVCRSGSNS